MGWKAEGLILATLFALSGQFIQLGHLGRTSMHGLWREGNLGTAIDTFAAPTVAASGSAALTPGSERICASSASTSSIALTIECRSE